jgi:hypothetical protein
VFLGEEVDSTLVTKKIRGESVGNADYVPPAAALRVSSKPSELGQKGNKRAEPFCVFFEAKGHWAQDCKRLTSVTERRDKVKSTDRCFLCLNRGHSAGACSKTGKVFCSKWKKEHHQSVCMDKETTTS